MAMVRELQSKSGASSTGRCNTIQYIDSTMLLREKRSVWLYSVKTPPGSVPDDL